MNVITKTDLKKVTVWTNLLIGLFNLNTFVQHDSLVNLIIGSINIGVWVFFRNSFNNEL